MRTELVSRVRLPGSNDTRLLLAGVLTFLGLVAYLAVAFATTHIPTFVASPDLAKEVAPWEPHASNLVPLPLGEKGSFAVQVIPTKPGNYGALVPTLVSQPPSGYRFVVGLWLRGAPPGEVGVSVDEFAPGETSVYVVQTTVAVTKKWRHFTFHGRVKGSWLGLGMYVYRTSGHSLRTHFAVRGLTAKVG